VAQRDFVYATNVADYERQKGVETRIPLDMLKWWLEPELNRRHKDFQSSALPTELSSHDSDAYIENLFRPFRKRQFVNFAQAQ
jgi:hypothetical protein